MRPATIAVAPVTRSAQWLMADGAQSLNPGW